MNRLAQFLQYTGKVFGLKGLLRRVGDGRFLHPCHVDDGVRVSLFVDLGIGDGVKIRKKFGHGVKDTTGIGLIQYRSVPTREGSTCQIV